MTPLEVLEEVKGRFIVLYHDDNDALKRLLKQALGKYQDKAGAIAEIWEEEKEVITIPSNFLSIAGVCDVKRRYIPYRLERKKGKVILILNQCKHEAPYCLYYFLNLRNWGDNEELPPDVPPLLSDYLEALLAIYNNSRQKETYIWTGVQASQELPSYSELKQRCIEIEQEMEAQKALIPPASCF